MNKNIQEKYFEKKENRYNEHLLFSPPSHVVDEIQHIINGLKCRSINSVVDFGCGNGRLTIPLLMNNIHVTAVDISRNSLNTLIKHVVRMKVDKGAFHVSNMIPHKKWNAIVGCDILHHVPLRETLAEMRKRLTDKKGIIIFSEPNILNLSWSLFVTLKHNWGIEKGLFHCNYFNFQKQLKNNNFCNVQLHGFGLFPPIFFNKFSFLQKINYFLGDLLILKVFAYRFIITAQAD